MITLGLKHCETRDLEGSRVEFGGRGGALVALGETHTHSSSIETSSFTELLVTFQKGGWVQAHKELILSVLEKSVEF